MLTGAFRLIDQESVLDLEVKIVAKGKITVPTKLPDRDGDGVPDYRDRMPDVKGLPKYDGDTEDRREWGRRNPLWPTQTPNDWSRKAKEIVFSEFESGLVKPGDEVTYRVEEIGTEWIMTGCRQTKPWTKIRGPYLSLKAKGWTWQADFQRELEIECCRFRAFQFIKIVNGKEVARYLFHDYLYESKRIRVKENKTVQVGHFRGFALGERPPVVPEVPTKENKILWLEFTDLQGDPLPPQKDYSGLCKELK
jgi:hypothetical protein